MKTRATPPFCETKHLRWVLWHNKRTLPYFEGEIPIAKKKNTPKKLNRKQQVTLTVQELEKVKMNATIKAVRMTNYFPLLILRDHFGFGEVRLKRFQEKYAAMWDDFNTGLIDIDDIATVLEEEVNITWDEVEDTVK